jgi:hypothetical protein
MTVAILMAWFAGALSWAAPPQPPPDLHVVFRSEFVYMSSTRATANEWWLSVGKSLARQGDRLNIYREDLGVVWRASVKAGTYTETKLLPAGQAAAPPPDDAGKVDMHTAGYDWEAAYDWTVKASGQSSTIAGRPCREFVATGHADYAEARVSFWACDPLAGVTRSPTDVVAASLRSDSAKRMIFDTLAKHGRTWLLAVEEEQEPAIAPTMVIRVRVETLEAGAAPAGTFDLPSTFKKAGR